MAAGAVLCGGASRRMGSDKALIEVDGIPMAQRVITAIESAGCDPVVVCGGDAVALAGFGAGYVADGAPGEGPVGGILAALRYFESTEFVVITSCDLAYLERGALTPLLQHIATDSLLDVAAARSDRLEPLCAAWRTSTLVQVERLFDAGERAVIDVLAELRVGAVDVDPLMLRNINTRDDLP
jgi:molybdopterin-guanine dinucleotide biosynthesis protein A